MAKAKDIATGTSWWLAPAFLGLAALLGWGAFLLNAETRAAERATERRLDSDGSPGGSSTPPAQAVALPPSRLAASAETPSAAASRARSGLELRGPRDEALYQRIENRVANAMGDARSRSGKAGQSAVSYRVIDLSARRVLAERQPTAPLAPASNLKALTTFAALRAAA